MKQCIQFNNMLNRLRFVPLFLVSLHFATSKKKMWQAGLVVVMKFTFMVLLTFYCHHIDSIAYWWKYGITPSVWTVSMIVLIEKWYSSSSSYTICDFLRIFWLRVILIFPLKALIYLSSHSTPRPPYCCKNLMIRFGYHKNF